MVVKREPPVLEYTPPQKVPSQQCVCGRGGGSTTSSIFHHRSGAAHSVRRDGWRRSAVGALAKQQLGSQHGRKLGNRNILIQDDISPAMPFWTCSASMEGKRTSGHACRHATEGRNSSQLRQRSHGFTEATADGSELSWMHLRGHGQHNLGLPVARRGAEAE
eukprot:3962842-Amphidinium_carterae.5